MLSHLNTYTHIHKHTVILTHAQPIHTNPKSSSWNLLIASAKFKRYRYLGWQGHKY